MRQYPYINFTSFTILEICEFVKNKISKDMEYLFALLHKEVIEKESILFEEDSEGLLSLQFLQLQDECKQLMRLETLALFPYIREQMEQSEQVHVNPKTSELLFKSQQKVLSLMNKIKYNLNRFTSYKV